MNGYIKTFCNHQYYPTIQQAFFYLKPTLKEDFIDLKETVQEYLHYFYQGQNVWY